MADLFKAIQIQTRTGCPRRCNFCANTYVKTFASKEMPDFIFESIVSQLQSIGFNGRISPYLMNEPLLDKRLEQKIHSIRKACSKAHLRFNTNGDLLTSDRLKLLFEAGLDGLIVDCYDSPSQYTDKLTMIEATLAEYKDIVVQPDFDIRAQSVNRKFVQVYDCSDYHKEASYLTNFAGHVVRDIGIQLPLKRSCFTVFEQMYINYKGEAILCCQDWGFQVVLGNVLRDGLLGIWNGERVKHYRERLTNNDRGSLLLCKTCDARSHKDLNYSQYYDQEQLPLAPKLQNSQMKNAKGE